MPHSALDALPLTCPMCGQDLYRRTGSLVCPARHTFDIARHGYVNLAAGRALVGDTTAMVVDRDGFLAAGHYRPLAERVAALAADVLPDTGGLVVDAGGGTGYYLAHVLDAAPAASGLVIDSSVAAVRRAAKAHPQAAAVAWNVWERWPLEDGSAHLVLDVFAPRNADEFHRVLRRDGALLVVTPAPDHLAEVREVARLIGVDERKPERLDKALAARFRTETRERLAFAMRLDEAGLRQVVGMGPSAHHRDPADQPVPGGITATASFVLTVYRPVPHRGTAT
ncbi:methyltransferase domain-containing protein [Pseudonocardia aurantiaca]|uniref:RNA methyltransferase n=1 Tax=Pseudonocardia aurantiaca TaxID=75290 RepID=A0ABW4FJW7_9PSEU